MLYHNYVVQCRFTSLSLGTTPVPKPQSQMERGDEDTDGND